jgi:hypothetical protein
MPLFEVAILETPKKGKDVDDTERVEKLVFGPVWTIAKDPQSAAIAAILDNAKAAAEIDRNRMQVLVRPF